MVLRRPSARSREGLNDGHRRTSAGEQSRTPRPLRGRSGKWRPWRKATQLGGMENAPKGLARMILAEQVREALGHNEAED